MEPDTKLVLGVAMIVAFSIFLFFCLIDRITNGNSDEQ